MSLSERLELSTPPLYLIDGSAFIYRGFYAFRDMSTADGMPTNALYFILRLMLRILREETPQRMAFVLDGPGKNFRHELFPEYKAQRDATPEDLVRQLDPIKQAVQLLGIPLHVAEGCEADDCIASLAARYESERPVIIIGADKDLKQCLTGNVWMWDPSGKKEKLTGLAEFREETGLAPASWPDFQALIGDSSDNIPGLPGVGPKTAQKIMADYATLEEIFDHLPAIEPKFRKKLEGKREDAETYRQLTRLDTQRCLELDDDALTPASPDLNGLRAFFEEYEFRSMLRDLPRPAPRTVVSGTEQNSLFPLSENAPKAKPLNIHKAASADGLPAPDGLRVGLVPNEDKLPSGEIGFQIGVQGEEWAVACPVADLVSWLAKAERVAVPSLKELYRADATWRDLPLEKFFDLSLAAYLLNPEERGYSFEQVCRLFEHDPETDPVHPDSQGLKAAVVADALEKKIHVAEMTELMAGLEMPLIPVLADMENAGLAIDLEAFAEFLKDVQEQIDVHSGRIIELAGEEFNIRSSQQMAEVLFNKLGLKAKGKTPGGVPSTSSTVLEKLHDDHEIIPEILEFRMLEKLRSTYLAPLPRMVDANGRLHTTFNNLATATGRLSSSGPNLQNIPIRGRMGKRMRACFTAGPGNLLAAADYSQIELRLLAHLSGDPGLVDAFLHGKDIHSRTAGLLFGKETAEVSPDERRNAKTINFGLLYGMGPQRLARELKITMVQAKDFIARYFERMPRVREFYDAIEKEAKEKGSVTTIMGRRRLLPDINSRNNNLQSQARRQAINTRVQGSAADIIKKAMIDAAKDEQLRELNAVLVLQVHDELLVETPEATAQQAGERLQEIMSSVADLSVPLTVDMGVGKNWAQAH
ncbi:MAG: DNA polymerase I [Desulfovibrio sp.]|uniref:DNA polymerase I n=1 Tax=Desulfovibrio sp. 7SRBS1 TaxID=3378064 RepID=UPI003B3EB31B